MNRRVTVAAVTALAVGAAGVLPALAAPDGATAKRKPVKGTWSFTDATPDPTVSLMGLQDPLPARDGYCVGTLPAAPSDVNVHTLKIKAAGYLRVAGTHTGDWAMEVRDSKNRFLGGNDGDLPQDQEGVSSLLLRRAGTYRVIYCNLGGAPNASATYAFRYR
jgi:hypothetical protein